MPKPVVLNVILVNTPYRDLQAMHAVGQVMKDLQLTKEEKHRFVQWCATRFATDEPDEE